MLELMGQTCQILTAGTKTNGFGTTTAKDWANPAKATHPCRLQLSQGTEDVDGREVAIATGKLFLPPDAVVDTHKRAQVDGMTLEVVSVYPVHEPQGLHHYEVQVRTFSGGVPSGP